MDLWVPDLSFSRPAILHSVILSFKKRKKEILSHLFQGRLYFGFRKYILGKKVYSGAGRDGKE